MPRPAVSPLQGRITLRFLGAMAAGNLLWEMAHVPLYTLWVTGSPGDIAYAVLHCTAGDVLIAGFCLLLSVALIDRSGWPRERFGEVALTTIVLALCYTVFSEWLNTEVRGSWTYRETMPRVPGLGIGLTPVLQWIVVPGLAFSWARSWVVRE